MICRVPPEHVAVITRFGRYSRTAGPGLIVLMPLADQVWKIVDLRQQTLRFTPQPFITSDEFVVTLQPVLTLQVVDAKAATLEIADYAQAMERLIVTALRNSVGGRTPTQVRSSPAWIATEIRNVVTPPAHEWGLRIDGLEIEQSR